MQRFLARAALYLSLAIPSSAQIHKYTGAWGLVAYGLALAIVMRWWPRFTLDRRTATRIALGVSVAVVALFLVGFPIANSGQFGPGSDTDEAYDLAVAALLDGRYPYEVETYLGNRVHHMPGALLLAVPFVLLGTSAYQSLVWLPLFFLVARRELDDDGEALALYLAVILLSPVVLQQIVTGNDGVFNGVSVLVGLWWVARSDGTWYRSLALVLLALAVSNRPNFFLVAIPLFAYLANRESWRVAIGWSAVFAALVAVINVPFLLHDAGAFSPFEGVNRLSRFENLLPHAGIVLLVSGLIVTVVASLRVRNIRGLIAVSAATQFFFVALGIVLSSIRAGGLDLAYAGYGTFFLFSGALAAWPDLRRSAHAAPTEAWAA